MRRKPYLSPSRRGRGEEARCRSGSSRVAPAMPSHLMHLTMASRMLVRVRSRESGTAGRRSCSCKPNLKDSKWPVTKPISPIYRTREACITTTRLSSTGTRTSMTLTRCVFQTLGQAPTRRPCVHPHPHPPNARTLARSHQQGAEIVEVQDHHLGVFRFSPR